MIEIDEPKALHAAFDETKIVFHDRAAALAKFKEGREIIFGDDGQPYSTYDGETSVRLADALTRWALDTRDPALFDGRSLPRHGANGRPGIISKADFDTVASRVAYITEFGEDSWARLPLKGIATSEILTKQSWMKLPLSEKVRRTAADPDAFSKLPDKPTDQIRGSFIHHAAIAREKLKRGGR